LIELQIHGLAEPGGTRAKIGRCFCLDLEADFRIDVSATFCYANRQPEHPMDFYETVARRRSVRVYLRDPIPQDKLNRIWEAVRLAPSACNLQPWRFLVVKTPAMRTRITPVFQDWVMRAPLQVIALGNRRTAWQRDGESIHPIDVAIAVEHLALAAAAEGLGTCWICAFDRGALRRALALDPDWDPVAVTPIGYPDDPNPRTTRKGISEIFQEI
jgi:nitroreductase